MNTSQKASDNGAFFDKFDTPFDTPVYPFLTQNTPKQTKLIFINKKRKSPETLVNTGLVGLFVLEVPPGFEPGHNGFADRGLTAWL